RAPVLVDHHHAGAALAVIELGCAAEQEVGERIAGVGAVEDEAADNEEAVVDILAARAPGAAEPHVMAPFDSRHDVRYFVLVDGGDARTLHRVADARNPVDGDI